MKKKILSLCLVVVLLLTAITGTLAYFTDTEEATNVFTVGSVDIQLLESRYYTNTVTKTADEIRADAATYADYLANEAGKNVVPGREFKKCIYIDNTGKNDAYYRIRMIVTRDQFNSFSFNENSTRLEDGYFTKQIIAHGPSGDVDYTEFVDGKNTDWAGIKDTETWNEWITLEYIYTCTEVLEAGELSAWSPVDFFMMKKDLDNEDVEGLKLNTNILVYADAIQAEGFGSAKDAFAAFDGQEVGDKVEGNAPDSTDTVFYVKTAEELKNTLAAGGTITLAGNIAVPPVEGSATGSQMAIVYEITKDTELNLGGNTIEVNEVPEDGFNGVPVLLYVSNGANMTIDNGTVSGEGGWNSVYPITIDGGATLTINGGTYTGSPTAVYVYNGKLIINGGFFSLAETISNVDTDGDYVRLLINCLDDSYTNGTATIEIKGGTFVNYNPAEARCEPNAPQNFVPEGYEVVSETQENGDVWYTVQKIA